MISEGNGWNYNTWRNAIAETNQHINNPGSILFQPAQVNEKGVFALNDRLDIGADGEIVITEFKASTKVSNEHIVDVAIQKYVLDTLGYDVVDTKIAFLNNRVSQVI